MRFATHNSPLQWTLLVILTILSEYGVCRTTVLLKSVSVSRDTIRLSDLLPPDASDEERRAAEQIELGRTPQCHTLRVFESSDIEKKASASPSPELGRFAFSGPVSVYRTCFPIRRDAVQRVIAEFGKAKGAPLTELPLHWPEVIYARSENPALQVEQVSPDPARSVLQIRLGCVERLSCPSFWVTVSAEPGTHLSSGGLAFASATAPVARSAALVESGQRVMLVLEDPPMRIQLPVICLQRGSLGKQVRATDPMTHRVFQAEVTGVGTLMAHL